MADVPKVVPPEPELPSEIDFYADGTTYFAGTQQITWNEATATWDESPLPPVP